jgi:hypothetical protein
MMRVSCRWSVVSLLLSATVFLSCCPAEAQQSKKSPAHRIPIWKQFRREITRGHFARDCGNCDVEGQNIVIEWRFAEGTPPIRSAECLLSRCVES